MRSLLTTESTRVRIQYFVVYILFLAVSLVMSLVNYLTGFRLLMYATLVFGLANLLNLELCLLGHRTELLSRHLFGAEILALFAFFVITGEPDGFSALWVVLLPACGLLLFRMKHGLPLIIAEWLILIFFFWTPIGQALLQYEYSATFMLRFPILYFAFAMSGFFFEFIRSNTQEELIDTRSRFEYLSVHDALTGLYNRNGFNHMMSEQCKLPNRNGYAFAIFDLDLFKNINDTYGHNNGDVVLRRAAQDLSVALGEVGVAARWGGEEFAALIRDADHAWEICEKIATQRRESDVVLDNGTCRVTVSVGLLIIPAGYTPTTFEIFTTADRNLYAAKGSGRDRIIATNYSNG